MLYTDGVTEAMSSSGEAFGIERLRQVFAASPPASSQEASRTIFDAVSSFAGDTPQSDDVTCVTLRRTEPGS